jgi:hypothetical protein
MQFTEGQINVMLFSWEKVLLRLMPCLKGHNILLPQQLFPRQIYDEIADIKRRHTKYSTCVHFCTM